jgi:hypothetical protein
VELLGVAEVEGDEVFAQLLADTGNTYLQVVSDPTPGSDLRGIDVSLAYDRKLKLVERESFTTAGVSPPKLCSPTSARLSSRHVVSTRR